MITGALLQQGALIYIYIYIYIGGLGQLVRLVRPLDREINFDFDSFASGEAKLRERVRGASLSLGLPVGSCPARAVPYPSFGEQ
jgi:hypothetical protein